ncbi:MAG TPA: GGDEF domain-containing protein [Rheinheimera sp.]|nr:GGDEF domain-containing protein [Rheinheimera sp.]
MTSTLLTISQRLTSCLHWLFGFCLCLVSLSSVAYQEKPLLQPVTAEDGLQSGPMQTMLLDHSGFLWLASSHGLGMYDANRVQAIPFPGFADGDVAVADLLEDHNGRLFIAALNIGLYQLDRYSGTMELLVDLAQQEQINSPSISRIAIDDDDHLWLGISQGLYRYSITDKRLTKVFEFDPGNLVMPRITRIVPDGEQVFVGTSRGLFVVDKQTGASSLLKLEPNQSSRATVREIELVGQELLIAQEDKLYTIARTGLTANQQPSSPQQRLSDIVINQLQQTSDGFYLASNDGLYHWNFGLPNATLLWRFSDSNLEITQNNIPSMVATSDGGYWLASRDDGVFYWHPHSRLFHQVELPTPSQRGSQLAFPGAATAMAEANADEVWLAGGSGLTRLDVRSMELQQFDFPAQLPENFGRLIARIYPDSDGKLWLRNGNSLHYYDPVAKTFLPPPLQDPTQQPLLERSAVGHLRTDDGVFWFYNRQHYFRYDPKTGVLEQLTGIEKIVPPHQAGRMLGYRPGSTDEFIFSAYDQLWVWQQKTGQLRKIYEAKPYQPSLKRTADRMCVDQQQRLWFTIYGVGLVALDGQTLHPTEHLAAPSQLLSNSVFSCELDDQGDLWFASNAGLSRLHTQSLKLDHFGKPDGLSTSQFIMGASSKLKNGMLMFGNNRGLTLFDPQLLQLPQDPPKIVITSVGSMDKVLSHGFQNLSGQTFVLPHDSAGVRVQFASLSYRDAGRLRYSVWLDGKQELRFPEQSSNVVMFPQLAPGKYFFHVMATVPATGRHSEIASVELIVARAPWLSPWALGSYGMLVLIVLLAWVRNRNTQKRLLAMAHFKVKTSEQRLKQALEVVNSGVWDWYASRDSLFAQRISTMLGYNEELNPLTMAQHIMLIHPDDREGYQQAWQRFIQTPDGSIDYTYRLQHKAGHWLWFRDIGKVTEFNAGAAQRVIGTYANITETRATKEKARLFGEAFQQTRDWVVLLDPKQRVIAANQSFSDVFGNLDENLVSPKIHELGISRERRRFYTGLLSSMHANQHWQGEELVVSPDGTERPTLLNISAVGDDSTVEFFVLVFTDITAQKQAEDNLRYLANYDALTGLPNRALLMDRIFHGIEQAKREQRSLALCFIDLDKFKQINDSLGHDIGDLLLKQVAKRLTSTLRLTDTVARLGGDEFVVLLESYKNDDNISHVARKMIKSIGEPMLLSGHTVSVSPSIGIAIFPDDAHDATELLKHADVAMYHAKDLGRNNFQFFIQEMNDKAQVQLQRETRLRSAWQHNEFINYYQPIYDSMLQQIVGVEVLMRWQDADTLVPPNDFIPLAEDLRLIVPMTQALLVRALQDLQRWQQLGHQLYVSVNLSPRHLEQANLAIETAALLNQYQIKPSSLRFEVTESALMQDHHKAIATMLALSELGVQIALDDFGTGYSSLKYLKELPIDGIKIDRSFVKDIGIDRNDETIIEAMLSMADSLGMYCIAEGVETDQQLLFFSKRGCHLIQGYLFGKPMPASVLEQLLTSTELSLDH